MNLFVFSSHRALLNTIKNGWVKDSSDSLHSLVESAFIPPYKTISDFFENVVIFDGIKLPKKSPLRNVFLWNAIKHIEIKDLGFEKAFVRFLENSNFIFKFFDELESVGVKISEIDVCDTYGDYSDHLRILEQIFEAYNNELKKYDLITTNTSFKINECFLKSYKHIFIYLDGIFTQKEMQILRLCAEFSDITIFFTATKYNINLLEKMLSLHLEQNTKYSFNVNNNKLCVLKSLERKIEHINIYRFGLRINQALLVIAKINQWLKDGIENIAVILPDEMFAKYLQVFDKKRNLNYAMGFDDVKFIKKLQDLKGHLKVKTSKETLDFILQEYKLENELEIIAMRDILEQLKSDEIIELLLQNITNLDDNNGGKVSVMGILESRAMEFERIIIIDFNNEFIPKLNDNDMFLNTNIRKRLNLPTLQDKENLQRHYYFMLINNSKFVEIAYCDNGIQSNLINDLEDMGVKIAKNNGDELWRFSLIEDNKSYIDDEIIAKNSYKKLSASAIKVFLTCKRKFYFQYMCDKLKGESKEFLGTHIHNLLYDLGKDFDATKITKFIESKSICERLDLEIMFKKLEPFFQTQLESLKNNRTILALEQSKDFKIRDFDFTCKVDRIDEVDSNKIQIIDYKIKNKFDIKTEGFLQLLIYKIAFCDEFNGKEFECLYYDLPNNKQIIMDSKSESEAKEILDNALDELSGEINFSRCDNIKTCTYCDYIYLCNRY